MIRPDELHAFLVNYATHFNFVRAAREIGHDASGLYKRLKTDAEFKRAFTDVKNTMGDFALAEAYRRAVNGTEKGIYYLGQRVDTEQVYSDSLLMQILKATRPEFREQLDLSNPDGTLQANEAQIAARVASILAIAQARRDRGEIIDAEIVEPVALPKPRPEDLV